VGTFYEKKTSKKSGGSVPLSCCRVRIIHFSSHLLEPIPTVSAVHGFGFFIISCRRVAVQGEKARHINQPKTWLGGFGSGVAIAGHMALNVNH
jgi:hypothetical protein